MLFYYIRVLPRCQRRDALRRRAVPRAVESLGTRGVL